MWDDKAMRYTAPVAYKNNVLDGLIPAERKTVEDVKEHVADLIPFLEPAEKEVIDTGTFHLEKIVDVTEHKSKQAEGISDDDFQNLLPGNK